MNQELLHILACPRCHGSLELKTENNEDQGLVCHACALFYPIQDQIPVMLIEEALPFPLQEDKVNKAGSCACS